MELNDWRDLAVIAYSVAGTLAFALIIVFTLAVGLLAFSTLQRTRRLLKDSVQPALNNVRETTGEVRHTVSFISDNAIKPVVKVYGTYAGARRFVSVVSGLRRPKKAP